jgi:hypothetical protein
MGLFLCLIGFTSSLVLGRRSLTVGLGAVLAVGYLYGILRANYLDTYAHFIFDAAVLGLYLSQLGRKADPAGEGPRRELRTWVAVLIGWACFMALLPLQHPLIQLVGLRGNAFLLPFLLVGERLGRPDARRLALWIAALNLVALGFASAEYFRGVPAFYPKNAVTEIIYKSNDVAGYTAYRIPATFVTAHAFAGTMVGSLPWLLGAWFQPGNRGWQHALLASAVAASVLGVFMSATRLNMILVAALFGVLLLSGRLRFGPALALGVVLAGVGYLISGDARLQRFTSLENTVSVKERIEGSVNMSFAELLMKYPIGNGLGGGGTSIPFFLHYLLKNPIGLENEYSRILLELGLPGLGLWAGFIGWTAWRRPAEPGDPWLLGRRLMWFGALAAFATGFIGTGMLTAIPQAALLFISIGFLAAPREARPAAAAPETAAPNAAAAPAAA